MGTEERPKGVGGGVGVVGGEQNRLVFLSVRGKSDTKMVVSTVTTKVGIKRQISNIILVNLMVTRIWGKVLCNLIAQTGSAFGPPCFLNYKGFAFGYEETKSIHPGQQGETQTSHAIRWNRCQRVYVWGGRGSKTPDKNATNTRGKMQENEEVVAH